MIQFTTTGSALPSVSKKQRRARFGVGLSLRTQAAREDGLFWGAVAVAIVVAALTWAGVTVASDVSRAQADHRRIAGAAAARSADPYYREPRCVHIRDLPLRKAFTQADIDRLCINPLPRRA